MLHSRLALLFPTTLLLALAFASTANAGPPPLLCGDGFCDPATGESCVFCPIDCGPCPSSCGNGIVELGEQCDDGNNVSGDGCSSTCMLEGTGACGDGTCTVPGEDCFNCPADCPCAGLCGDGLIGPGEQCDLTNLGASTCISLGFGGGVLACTALCTFDTTGCTGPTGMCGDGTVDAGEDCDDGNTTGGDGCSATCTFEPMSGCGDGTVDAGEECDDGNTTDGDGCSAVCMLEGMGVCGDGVIGVGEWCDDGNTVDGDGCSSTCMVEAPPTCGDGNLDPGEECEPPGDPGCDDDCQLIGAQAGCGCRLPGRGRTNSSAPGLMLLALVLGLALYSRRRLRNL